MDMTAASVETIRPDLFNLSLTDIEAGVPTSSLLAFVESSGFSLRELHEIVIPARTLKHRKARHEPLSLEESDKLARVIRIYRSAVSIFGDADKARRWLGRPKHRFDERTPLQMLRTEVGGHLVQEMLIQIDEGMFC